MSVMGEPHGNGPALGVAVDEAFYRRPSPVADGDPLSRSRPPLATVWVGHRNRPR